MEVCTHWRVLKLFTIRDVVLNLTMIEFVDQPFYGRELVGDLVENKMNCQRFNINLTESAGNQKIWLVISFYC